jgi:hypothetical protein
MMFMEDLGFKLENFDLNNNIDLNTEGASLYENFVQTAPGLDSSWSEMGGGKEEFVNAYRDYITNGEALKSLFPDRYEFFRDHIFYGKEFETSDIVGITYGNPEEWGRLLDWKQGDNEFNFQGDCGLVSCENILKQAGIDIGETDIVGYAGENGLCEIYGNPEECGGTTADQQAELLTELGVPSHVENNISVESLAEAVKENHGAIIEINAGALWNDYTYYGSGEANHAISVTGVEINGSTGAVDGFYVCDSGRGQAADGTRFLTCDEMKDIFYCDSGSQAVITNGSIKS